MSGSSCLRILGLQGTKLTVLLRDHTIIAVNSTVILPESTAYLSTEPPSACSHQLILLGNTSSVSLTRINYVSYDTSSARTILQSLFSRNYIEGGMTNLFAKHLLPLGILLTALCETVRNFKLSN